MVVLQFNFFEIQYGSDSKLVLEYSWDSLTKSEDNKKENDLTNSLKKLLSLAKLHCDKTVVKCTCGHVCGGKTTTQQFKKPITAKVVKKTQVSHEVTPIEEKTETKTVPEEPFIDTSSSVVQLFNQRDVSLPNGGEMALQIIRFQTIQRLNPKFRNRGRTRYKQLVVERKLVPNKSENKHEIVSMDIVSQESKDEIPVTTSELPSMLRTESSRDEKNFVGRW